VVHHALVHLLAAAATLQALSLLSCNPQAHTLKGRHAAAATTAAAAVIAAYAATALGLASTPAENMGAAAVQRGSKGADDVDLTVTHRNNQRRFKGTTALPCATKTCKQALKT
jgi:hypothetical protein